MINTKLIMNTPTSKSSTTSVGTHIMELIKYMKNKVPMFILFIHVVFFNYEFNSYDSSVENYNTDTHCNETVEKHDVFIGYYVVMSIICVVWEFLYCYFRLKHSLKTLNKRDYVFCSLSTVVSLLAFLSTTFFMDINNVYHCFLNYDKVIAGVVFFLSYALIIGFSTLEKYCFSSEVKIMATNVSSSPINQQSSSNSPQRKMFETL